MDKVESFPLAFYEAHEIGPLVFRTVSTGPGFWDKFPTDQDAMAKIAKPGAGIFVFFELPHAHVSIVKNSYGPFSCWRLLRRLEEWEKDRVAFIKKYSPKLSAEMPRFEQDYRLDRAKTVMEYLEKYRALPKPPAGYYWAPDDRGMEEDDHFLCVGVVHTVRLWNDAFGPMPGCNDRGDWGKDFKPWLQPG